MKIILLDDVKSLGKKGEVVEVNPGYGRNMLIKKHLGVEATPKALNDLKLQKANDEKMAAIALQEAKDFAKKLEDLQIVLTLKTGEGGKIFGSVSGKEIAQAAKEQLNILIDKKKLQMENPIRSLGVTEVPLKIHPQVTGKLKVWVKEAK